MGRETGPRLRRVRRTGTPLPGLTRKTLERKPYPPGQHGPGRRRRISEYAVSLAEKQKLQFHYGLTESQLRSYVRKSSRMKATSGTPGDNLASLLELRLDNVVFRLGLAPTIPASRQLVRHGHILVNGRRVNIPSFQVSKGDRISIKAASRGHPSLKEGPQLEIPAYLARDRDGMGGRCKDLPVLGDIPIDFDSRLVTEFYATRA